MSEKKKKAEEKAQIAWKKVEELDPRFSNNQMILMRKAMSVCNDMLNEALNISQYEDSEKLSIDSRAKALNAYIKFREMTMKDLWMIMQELMEMDDDRVKIMLARLKKEKLMTDFVKGKLKVEDIYSLPKKISEDLKDVDKIAEKLKAKKQER